MNMRLSVKLLVPEAHLPTYGSKGAAGMDLHSIQSLTLNAGDTRLVGTGIAVAIPQGWVGLVCSRSGLAVKHSVFVLNAPGVIDSDYRGEVGVILHNAGRDKFAIRKGDRIAQMLVQQSISPWIAIAKEIGDTERGQGGFGSTGA